MFDLSNIIGAERRVLTFVFDRDLKIQAVEVQAATKEDETVLKEIAFKMMGNIKDPERSENAG